MSANVPDTKLPFGIQAILDDYNKTKFSKPHLLIADDAAARKSFDRSTSPKDYHLSFMVSHQFPYRNKKAAAFEVISALPFTGRSKSLHDLWFTDEIQNYCGFEHFTFLQQYLPMQYFFPSTLVSNSRRPIHLNNFSSSKFVNLSINNSPHFYPSNIFQPTHPKSGNFFPNQRFVLNSYPSNKYDEFDLSENCPPLQSFSINNAHILSSNTDSIVSSKTQQKKGNKRACSTTIQHIDHFEQSLASTQHKKQRTSFTKKQIASLETRFLVQKYLASTERVNLASELEMSDAQVKTWFQNRRTKWRREKTEEKEKKLDTTITSSYAKCFFARPDIVL